jgi:hypothetical protein
VLSRLFCCMNGVGIPAFVSGNKSAVVVSVLGCGFSCFLVLL